MKKTGEAAYWIYAAGVVTSIGLLALSYWTPYLDSLDGPDRLVQLPSVLREMNRFDMLAAVMGLTLLYGLFYVMPMLLKSKAEKSFLTSRAAELEVAVVTDPLTGLYNRRYFEDALNEYLTEFKRIKAPLALLALDLDHFKRINDSYGHDAGDLVLKQVAARLKALTREHDIVARSGGEEFYILAPFSDEHQIEPFAERICQAISEMQVDVENGLVCPTVSIGVASASDGQFSPDSLKKISDARLYRAKELGRNRICVQT